MATHLDAEPSLLAATVCAGGGHRFHIRLLEAGDAEVLGDFLDSLTTTTRRVFGPHPLDSDHARVLCDAIDRNHCLRFVAVGPLHDDDGPPQTALAAYMILHLGVRPGDGERFAKRGCNLDTSTTTTFAPVVADAFQEHGLGSAMVDVVLSAARRMGRKQVILMGGVRDDNPRAQHFYEKTGFVRVGGFFAGGVDNHDMVLKL